MLERDTDIHELMMEKIEAKFSKLYVTSLGILITLTTASIMLALNLVIGSS